MSVLRRLSSLPVLAILIAAAVPLLVVFLRPRREVEAPKEKPAYASKATIFEPTPSASPGVTLQILSDVDGSPIKGASVDVALGEFTENLSDHDVQFLESDEQGLVTLSLEGRGLLQVKAKGFVGVQGPVQFRQGRFVLRLTPSGSLDLSFEGEDRKPVEGVEVEFRAMRPSRAPKRLDELREDSMLLWEQPTSPRQSDAKGAIRWGELMPGVEYRWKVLSSHVIEDSGQGPKAGVEAAPRGLKVAAGGSPLERVKEGRVKPDPGERLRVLVRVLQGASIQGTFPPGSVYPSVKVFHRTEFKEATGRLTKFDVESFRDAGEGGAFRFFPVRPGLKRLAAQWSDPSQNFYFARMHFGLQPAENKDVGVLAPQAGISVRGILKLEGKELLPSKRDWRGTVHFYNNPPRPFEMEDVSTDSFVIDVDRPFWIHGLLPGELQIKAWVNAEEDDIEGVHLEKPPQQDLALKGPLNVEFVAKVKAMAEVHLTATCAQGKVPGAVQVSMIPVAAGRTIELPKRLTPDPATGAMSLDFSLIANEYIFWARSVGASNAEQGEVFGETRARIAPGTRNEVHLELQTGVRVTGRVLDAGGNPASVPLHFSLTPPLPDGSRLGCASDAQGYYTLHGVPPFRLLKGPSGESVQTGAPGSESHLDLRVSR